MRGRKMDGFVTREQFLEDLFAAWQPVPQTEYVRLEDALGRVTARDIFSVNTVPVYRTSACDGIAVNSALFAQGMPDYTQWQEGDQFVRADTGDDFPDAYDAVIMIEEVDLTPEGRITFISPDIAVKPGSGTIPRGSSLRTGDLLLEAGLPIRPTDLATLAMGGCRMVPVRKKPVVAFLPTGSELVPAQMTPARGQTVDSNSLLIRETLRALGAQDVIFPITVDDPALLEAALDQALAAADIVLLNGGTARGGEDFNVGLIQQKGRLLHHYVAAAPGRPMAAGMIGNTPVLDLPGPTMAAFYSAEWCLSAVVSRALGIPQPRRERLTCTLAEDLSSNPHMAILCKMQVTLENGQYVARSRPFRGGSAAASLTSNAMYVSPVGSAGLKAGAQIEVELLRGLEYIR